MANKRKKMEKLALRSCLSGNVGSIEQLRSVLDSPVVGTDTVVTLTRITLLAEFGTRSTKSTFPARMAGEAGPINWVSRLKRNK